MSVIVAGMEMPEGCGGCPMSMNDICTRWVEVDRCDFRIKRSKDCPLKSAEGLIEKIKEYNEFSRDEIDELYMNDILKIIKEYCEKERS